MNTNKKNQHYIPKFYLRNFSYNNNKKQIGLFNLSTNFFFQAATLKDNGSKNFFYGADGIIEEYLSKAENNFANIIRDIIANRALPEKYSKEHIDLLYFVALTDFRNPSRVENIKQQRKEVEKRILELQEDTDLQKICPERTHEEIVALSLLNTSKVMKMILDLDYKLLINKTSMPFITSDFPVVKYNQFLEKKRWRYGKTGYSSIGLQIFIPLDSKLTILLYDDTIYRVGVKKNNTMNITNINDVDKLNTLQFINCIDSVFFDEKANEIYIKRIHKSSKKYQRANIVKSESSFLVENEKDIIALSKGKRNFIYTYKTDCDMNLDIDGLKMLYPINKVKLNEFVVQQRPWAEKVCQKYNSKL